MPRGDTWQARAERLGQAIPVTRLHPAVLAWVQDAPPAGWGIALSGGPDSVCLLLLVWAHFPSRRTALTALHFNHRLRGRAAEADVRFCRELARELKIKFATAAWTDAPKGASEEAARSARFAFLEGASRTRHLGCLWFGHQQDDIAETLLMRLSRGSGTGGLAAPRPLQVMAEGRVHVRPLLGLKKAEIETLLIDRSVPFRTDATNAGDRYFRNRVRSRVVPAWVEASGRDAVAGAALSRDRLEEDDRALEEWVDRLHCLTPAGSLRLTVLDGAPTAIRRRALHRWLAGQPLAGSLSRQGFDALLAAVTAGKPTRHSLGRQGFAVIRAGRLAFVLNRANPTVNTPAPRLT